MARPKITVKRKAHNRKAYLRKDGTRVKSAQIGASTFRIKDRGERGKTPKRERWFEPQVETGWEKSQNQSVRRGKVLKAHNGDYLASGRAMQALANITTDRETRKKARADAVYFMGEYKSRPHGITGRSKQLRRRSSIRITPRQPKLRR